MGFHGGFFMGLNTPDEKPKVTWKLMKRVLSYSYPYRWQMIVMFILITSSAGLTLLTPLILRDLIDTTIPSKNTDRLFFLAALLLIIPVLGGIINVFRRWLNARIGEGVIFDLRVALYSRLQMMSLRFFTHTKIGELMSRMNNDVVGAQNAISNTIVNILTEIIQAIAVITMMFLLEWRLTIISILIFPLFILAINRLGGRLRELARQQMDANARMNAMMNETLNIGGALLVKLFGRIHLETAQFQDRAARVRDTGISRAVTGSIFFVIIGFISAVGTALVYGIGGYLVIQELFTIGTIVAFGAYLTSLYSALQGLSTAPVEFATSVVSFERVFELLDLPIEIEEKSNAIELKNVSGELVFEDVNFRYEVNPEHLLRDVHRFGRSDNVTTTLSNGESESQSTPVEKSIMTQARENALEHISFRVKPGMLVALVGPSGAGKTTLTYLIPRLYDPNEGCIRIDGHDLKDVTLTSLRSQIGMVTQETYLFHDTIRTNLLYARQNATQDELVAATKAANIHDFILGLPDTYDTVVGERGYRLSGGEKQRIALARVILKDPRILVLDEATSHLDSESEALIQEALKHVMEKRTSIVIAHRLSTILAADLILVVDRGQILEQGTHDKLIQQNGLYAHLYETQFTNR